MVFALDQYQGKQYAKNQRECTFKYSALQKLKENVALFSTAPK
jgi:hypothetical protein